MTALRVKSNVLRVKSIVLQVKLTFTRKVNRFTRETKILLYFNTLFYEQKQLVLRVKLSVSAVFTKKKKLQNFSKIFSKTHQIALFFNFFSEKHAPEPLSNAWLRAMQIPPRFQKKYFEPPPPPKRNPRYIRH